MPTAGAVQVTCVELSCLQVEGGSWPFASPLWFVTTSAFISAVCVGFFGFGLADIDDMALAPFEPEALRPAQVPRPAATRTSATRTASQRGRRYQLGPRGRPADGWAPAG